MDETIICPNCRSQNAASRAVCAVCGTKILGHRFLNVELGDADVLRLQLEMLRGINGKLGFITFVIVLGFVIELLRLLFS